MSTHNKPNLLLAAAMAEARVSNKGLAARVRALADQDGHPISPDHVSVRRWLDGSTPRGRTSQYIAHALTAKLRRHLTPADLGLTTDGADEAQDTIPSDPVAASQHTWRDTRQHLIGHRAELSARAADLYDPSWRLGHTPMLSCDSWLPDTPIPLDEIELDWEPHPPQPIITGQEPETRALLPLRTRTHTFPTYSSAIRYLQPPTLFDNRPCYRLLNATLNNHPHLQFTQSCYFDKIDISEGLSHETAAAMRNGCLSWQELPFRSLITDPFDLAPRTVNTSITTLTLRRDRETGDASFFLLRRDSKKVVTGGGEYGLPGSGEFQPASISPDSLLSDLSIWRNLVREYSEELLGHPEHDGSSGRSLDYERWPFFQSMQRARQRGEIRAYVLGIAFNALSLNATIVMALVIDSLVFDSLFHGAAKTTAEGEIITHLDSGKEGRGVAFSEDVINRFLHTEPLVSPTTRGTLSLGWQHRAFLLQA